MGQKGLKIKYYSILFCSIIPGGWGGGCGGGRSEVWHKCFSGYGYLRLYKMQIRIYNWTTRWNEHTDVKDHTNRARNGLLFPHQTEAERVKRVACHIKIWCRHPMDAVDKVTVLTLTLKLHKTTEELQWRCPPNPRNMLWQWYIYIYIYIYMTFFITQWAG